MATPCSKRKMPLSMEHKKTTPETKTKENDAHRNTRFFAAPNNLPPREREMHKVARRYHQPIQQQQKPAELSATMRILSKWKGESAQVTGAHVGTG
jgi:hypothetical protein